MTQRKSTGALKKRVTMIDSMITMYLSDSMSQASPTQSSESGQSLSHGAMRVMRQEITMAASSSDSEIRNTMKLLWLFMPTQLLSQGQ